MSPSDTPLVDGPIATADGHDPPADLSSRARAWLFTRDPRALWPGLDPSLLQPSADAIARAIASLLRGDPTTLGSARGEDAYAIGVASLLTGTGPLLGYWAEQGSLDVSDPLAGLLARHLAHGRMRIERISREVAPALSHLTAAGSAPVVIKGFHTAHRYFPEPGLRPISDVDVVVAPDQVSRAETALRAAAFTGSDLICRPYKRDWYPPDDDNRIWSLELFHARDRWKLELHDGLNFSNLPSFGLRLNGGMCSGTPWYVHGVAVRGPAQPLLTVLLATHIAAELHTRCLLRVAELALVVRQDRNRGLLDWAALEALLLETGAGRFVYPALSLAEGLLPGTIDPGVLSRARRQSTRLTRLVTDRLTPTYPILDDRPILAERLMWVVNGRQLIQSVVHWLNPVPDRPWREVLSLYHSRATRMLSGRASWIARRGRA